MKKGLIMLAVAVTVGVALTLPAVAGAGIQTAGDITVGNDSGTRSAVVSWADLTQADEGPLLGAASCTPSSGSTFPLGTTPVSCLGLVDGGQTCFPLIGCFPNPDVLVGGGFNVTVNIVRCTLKGTGAANELVGTAERDWICALGGADVVLGGGGPDTLVGGLGRDSLFGGAANDEIRARDGVRDSVNCGAGGNDLAKVDSRDAVASNCERVRRG